MARAAFCVELVDLQAFVWFKISGSESNPNLSVAKAHMTPEAILEAERLAAEWKREHECSAQDLLAELKANDPAYVEAMELAQMSAPVKNGAILAGAGRGQ